MPSSTALQCLIGINLDPVVIKEGSKFLHWPSLKEGSCAAVASTPHSERHLQVPQRLTGDIAIA